MIYDKYITDIDIVLVAGRRPDLLERTLSSFSSLVFKNFNICDVFVNIDPIFGDDADHLLTINIVRKFFPNSEIFNPEMASFGSAVKSLWGKLGSRLAFHLEDDWIALEMIKPEMLTALLSDDIFALAPTSLSLRPPKKDHQYVMLSEKNKVWGPFKKKSYYYAMGTAPKFIDGELGRSISAFMDPNLDPEKQMLKGMNNSIFEILQTKRCGYILPQKKPFLIEDIGRNWREQRKIDKIVVDGKSKWVTKDEQIN